MHVHSINFLLYAVLDIDECSENADICDQNCSNTEGSYTCSCNVGYVLASNGHSCSGIYSKLLYRNLALLIISIQTLMSVLVELPGVLRLA